MKAPRAADEKPTAESADDRGKLSRCRNVLVVIYVPVRIRGARRG